MSLLIMKFFSKQKITQKCVLLRLYLDENILNSLLLKKYMLITVLYSLIHFGNPVRDPTYFFWPRFLRSLSVKKGKIFDHISWKLEMQIRNWLKNEGIGKLRVPSSKCPAAPDKIWVIRKPALRDWGLTAKNIEILWLDFGF